MEMHDEIHEDTQDDADTFRAPIGVHCMMDDYVRGIGSPKDALMLVWFFAQEKYIDVAVNAGLKFHGIDEIIEGALLGMGVEAEILSPSGEDAVEIGSRILKAVGVHARYRPCVRDPKGPIGYLDGDEVDALDMKRLRPLVELAVPRLATLERLIAFCHGPAPAKS